MKMWREAGEKALCAFARAQDWSEPGPHKIAAAIYVWSHNFSAEKYE
jgi:hypothetical protein